MAKAPALSEVEVLSANVLPTSDTPGLLLVDKPTGLTSFGVVKKVRRLTGIRKVGHSGTLDPMATGLLIVMLDRATRLMDTLLANDKTYTGVMRLGGVTPSFDKETEVTERRDASNISRNDVETAAAGFIGDIEQATPLYSAVKVGGERLYKKARRGERAVLPRRQVTIFSLSIDTMDGTDVQFTTRCSSGTYIRTLANDIGRVLGVGAYLTALRRTSIGQFDVADAWSLEAFERAIENNSSV
ncbi:MAG: tRNA pseudouridine(55) synthase TruB [Rhodothermales bacterium]